MARVYLMLEDRNTDDVKGDSQNVGISWSVNWGLEEGEMLPQNVDDMTEAQYTAWQFITVLRGMENSQNEEKADTTDKSRLILPPSTLVQ